MRDFRSLVLRSYFTWNLVLLRVGKFTTVVGCVSKLQMTGVANGTSKNVGLGKFWQDLEISETFLISLEVSFFHGLFLLFLSLETFHQRVSGSDF